MRGGILVVLALLAVAPGCGAGKAGSGQAGEGSEGGIATGPVLNLPDAGWLTSEDAAPFVPVTPDDASVKPQNDAGGYPLCDGGAMPADRFITQVVSFEAGACAGFGQAEMPEIVEGPPVGGGDGAGSLDVLSLGNGGTIVVAFGPNTIVDGPGPDFIVFENPFDTGKGTYAEPGQVSVSNDGVAWTTFPCTATSYPYGECAGWRPVLSNPDNCISPLDPATAGGDPFDLADVGVTSAKYVRIVDQIIEACPSNPAEAPNDNGFDLDAISIVNGSSAN